MLLCLLIWIRRERADYTYSLTLPEMFFALYVNKDFQCAVGPRLKCTIYKGTFTEQPFTDDHRVQRTYWKVFTIENFRPEIQVSISYMM